MKGTEHEHTFLVTVHYVIEGGSKKEALSVTEKFYEITYRESPSQLSVALPAVEVSSVFLG